MGTVDDLGVSTDRSLSDVTITMIPSGVLSELIEVLSHEIWVICQETEVVLTRPRSAFLGFDGKVVPQLRQQVLFLVLLDWTDGKGMLASCSVAPGSTRTMIEDLPNLQLSSFSFTILVTKSSEKVTSAFVTLPLACSKILKRNDLSHCC
eukprot:GABU01004139.1.p1 GENE.GABU01004139.1~~GABU01004139.1.p1  ORF type:complete len:150 (-),score=0.75 GABU01004139.1:63-512(-)